MLQEGVVFFRLVDASSISELGNGRDEAALTLKCRTDKTDIHTRILQTASLLGQNLQKLILSMFQEKANDMQNLSGFFLEASCLPIRSPSWLSEGLLMVQEYALQDHSYCPHVRHSGVCGAMTQELAGGPCGIFSTSQRISALTGSKSKWNQLGVLLFFNFTVWQINLSLAIDVDYGYEIGSSKVIMLNLHSPKHSNISCNCRRKREKGWMA